MAVTTKPPKPELGNPVIYAQVNKLSTFLNLPKKYDNVLYFVDETKQIYKGAELYSDPEILVEAPSRNEFPEIGNPHKIYLDLSASRLYYWNVDTSDYAKVSSGIEDYNCIYGGDASGI